MAFLIMFFFFLRKIKPITPMAYLSYKIIAEHLFRVKIINLYTIFNTQIKPSMDEH